MEDVELPTTRKRVVLVKEFAGLADALAPVLEADPSWEAIILEDFRTAEEALYTHDARVSECVRLSLEHANADLFLYEDPQNNSPHDVEALISLARMPGRFNVGTDARRLESRRSHGKAVCARLGLPFVPIIASFNLRGLKPGALEGLEDTLHDQGVSGVYAKFDSGPSLCGGDLATVFSRLAVESAPHDPADHASEEDVATCDTCKTFHLGAARRAQLASLLAQRRQESGDIVLEPLVATGPRSVEFSICMLCNGTTAFPVCTLMDLENRLFHGRLGPKISDVSQLIVAGVHGQWAERVVSRMAKWVAETRYVGWVDIDLMYDLDTDRWLCFEFMVRFAIPSMAAVLKLGTCNWLDVFRRVARGGSVTQADFGWKHPWAVSVGLFSFSRKPNSTSGAIPTEAPIVDYEDFWRIHPKDSHEHLIGIEVFDCQVCDVLELAGSDGRHLYAVGTGTTWREALGRAYHVARTVDYPNKVYKVNLFGFDSPHMCDSNLDDLLPTLLAKGILPPMAGPARTTTKTSV